MTTIPTMTTEERDAFLLEHAHRKPITKKMGIGADGDVLRLIIGTPSGACSLPVGEEPRPAWGDFLAAQFKVRSASPTLPLEMAQDVILWPAGDVVKAWTDRWPALPSRVFDLVQEKIGVGDEVLARPRPKEAPPSSIASALARANHGVWRRLKLGDRSLLLVVSSPNGAQWEAVLKGFVVPDLDVWPMAKSVASDFIKAIVDEEKGEPVSLSRVLEEKPGVAISLFGLLGQMVGLERSNDLGEW